MASSGIGNKFVSVNLNKSYGQQQQQHGVSGSGHPSGARSRPAGHGGMVVLSRPRTTTQAAGPKGSKLAVPPPLNLPSLRREHGGQDSGGHSVAPGSGGSSTGTLGWTKPPPPPPPLPNPSDDDQVPDRGSVSSSGGALSSGSTWGTNLQPSRTLSTGPSVDSAGRPNVYTPPAARGKSGGLVPSPPPFGERSSVVLRGEDFPSLQAALPPVSSPQQKQRDAQQKQRKNQEDLKEQKLKLQQLSQGLQDGASTQQDVGPGSRSRSPPPMRPQLKPRQQQQNSMRESVGASDRSGGLGGQQRKPEGYSSGPPPLVRLDHTSNWADDERDTGTGRAVSERDRDYTFTNGENVYGQFKKSGSFSRLGLSPCPEDRDAGAYYERGNSSGKDMWAGGGDVNFRKSSPFRKEGSYVNDMGFERDRSFGRSTNLGRENASNRDHDVDSKTIRGSYGRNGGQSWEADHGRGGTNGREAFGRERGSWASGVTDSQSRDGGFGQEGQFGNRSRDGFLRRGVEQTLVGGRYGDTFGRNRVLQNDVPQNTAWNKPAFSTGSRGMPVNDPILDFGRDKRSFASHGKPYSEDPFMKDFASIPGLDIRDPFVGSLGTEIKFPRRRKDDTKNTDFYDPIRESFEAELERVQKIQEQERQRMIEEQQRAQELARKEEEERQRRAREEEERQRRVEEEAREAAWRAEQAALEAARRVEEERRAREEEKRRINLEEERRKEAARRKLLELEERIAKRQAENKNDELPKTDEGRLSTGRTVNDRDSIRRTDTGEWEDEERKIDRITSSASSESSNRSRSYDSGLRSQGLRDVNSFAPDRTKPPNSWRRESTENGNGSHFNTQMMFVEQNNNYHNSNREAFHGGRGFPRRDIFEGARAVSGKNLPKMGRSETMQVNDHLPYRNDQRWIYSEDGTQYPRLSNSDSDFFDNTTDGYGDIGWEQEKVDSWRGRDRPRIPSAVAYPQGSEVDEFGFGRSRHFRQPRVLPPPVTTLQKGFLKNGAEKSPSSPHFEDESKRMGSGYDTGSNEELGLEQANLGNDELSEVQASHDVHFSRDQGIKKMIKTESQSLLSVSSLPSSPAHVSHDDMEDEGSPVFQQNEAGISTLSSLDGNSCNGISADLLKPDECMEYVAPPKSGEQEDHEEWAFEDDDEFLEEEEYEEEHVYDEENEVFEEEEENQKKDHRYEILHLQEDDIELKQKSDLHIDRVQIEELIGVETDLPTGNEIENELQGKPDAHGHRESSFKDQDLEVVENNENEMHDSEADMQKEGSVDDKKPSDRAQATVIHDSIVQQDSVEEASVAASMESLKIVQPETQISMHSMMQMPQQSLPTSSLPLPQSNIPSATTSTGPSILSPLSGFPSQSEMPFKLQFGLFPGTPILPATVPAIQIGSIQMPLHLHPQVSPSLTQIPPSQPPIFQFGQLRYPAPMSQGLLTLTQPPMPYVHPTVSTHYSLGQPVMPLSTQQILDSSIQMLSVNDQQQNNYLGNKSESVKHGMSSPAVNQHALTGANPLHESKEAMDKVPLSPNKNVKSIPVAKSNAGQYVRQQMKPFQHESEAEIGVGNKMYKPVASSSVIREQVRSGSNSVPSSSVLQTVGQTKGNRRIYGARADGFRASANISEGTWYPSDVRRHRKQGQGRRNIRRSEFRVSVDRRHLEVSDSSNLPRQEEKSWTSVQSDSASSSINRGAKKDEGLSAEKSVKSEGGSRMGYGIGYPSPHFEDKMGKTNGGKLVERSGVQVPAANGSRSTEGIPTRHEKSEVADDGPLQSGIVRIFKQSGIEAPSDEDDFIEVRSKRQMLNDRREQREKEIKAKSKDLKTRDQAGRRQRLSAKVAVQGDGMSAISHRVHTSSGGEKRNKTTPSAVILENASIDGRNLSNSGSSSLVASAAPQPLAPIGTPAGNTEGSNDKRLSSSKPIQVNPGIVISQCDADIVNGLRFENQSIGQDSIASSSLGAWGSTRTSQQVVSLTQIQLEEAMKPVCFESQRAALLQLGDHGGMALESGLSVASVLTQDKLSSALPLNSLLAGEKIQFGAVTSPTIVPPTSNSIIPPVSIGLGSSVTCRSEATIESGFSAPGSDSTNFFNKVDDRCRQLEDPEAEAEAAASAVAVAAISSDEPVGNGLGGVPMSAAENKAFGNLDVCSVSEAGVSTTKPTMIQSRGEDSMTVALPADLSVETQSPLSLWPSVASRQSSAGPILPHFPGTPSHFPCFEMGPMLGGPIFAFGQHEDSTSLSQAQKSSTSVEQGIPGMGPGPVGGWQQCPSGIDSFYGTPPSGFTGPFINPQGGIPGLQGPQPMFVYNAFPSVGQFGQVGFMSAYIPSGKQPDWKHTPASTSGSLNDGDIGNLGMMSAQRNASMPTSVQHITAGSSMMPVVPSLGLFDVNLSSPFQQSSADLPMQAQWSHLPGHPTFQTIPLSGPMLGLSMPLQQTEGSAAHLTHPSHRIESRGSGYHQVLASKTTGGVTFSSVDAAAQFPDELGLGDSVSGNSSSVLTSHNLSNNSTNYSSASANVKVAKGKSSSRSVRSSGTGSGNESSTLSLGTNSVTSSSQSLHGSRTVGLPFHQSQANSSQTTSGQYPHPVGYSEHRGTSQQHTGQKTCFANEWSTQSQRKAGGQGRSQMSGDKNYATGKIKQVYVAKPSSSTSNVGTPVTLL